MDYNVKLAEFTQRLQTEQREAAKAQGLTEEVVVFFETGRKFDKVWIKTGENTSVRYFVEKKTGTIYGAKSKFAPNPQWYFGDVTRCHLWSWGSFHGEPVNDPEIRAVKRYAGYTHFIKV